MQRSQTRLPDRAERRALTLATYEAAAGHFDAPSLSFWERSGRRTVDSARLRAGEHVLDVGCGTGACALPAALVVGAQGHVLGIDLSPAQLFRARTKARWLGLANVSLQEGDMTAIDLPPESFDAVLCQFALLFADDTEHQVAELWRLLRPGGRFVLTTWSQGHFEPAASHWESAVADLRPDLIRSPDPKDELGSVREVRSLLRRTGIREVDVVEFLERHPLGGLDDWWTIVLGSGMRWTVEQMEADEVSLLRASLAKRLREHAIDSIATSTIHAVATKPPSSLQARPGG